MNMHTPDYKSLNMLITPEIQAGIEEFRDLENEFPETDQLKRWDEARSELRHAMGTANDQLADCRLDEVILRWIQQLPNPDVRRNYRSYIRDFKRRGGFINYVPDGETLKVADFRLQNHLKIEECIAGITEWSGSTRQSRISCYRSLCAYLEHSSWGWFKRVRPSQALKLMKQENTKGLRKQQLTLQELQHVLRALHSISLRDSLIARLLLEAPTIPSVLQLRIQQINFDTDTIFFAQPRTAGPGKEIIYPTCLMYELQNYIATSTAQRENSELVFVTRNGKALIRSRFNYSFDKASKIAGLAKATLPALRKAFNALQNQGFDKEKILDLTQLSSKGDHRNNHIMPTK